MIGKRPVGAAITFLGVPNWIRGAIQNTAVQNHVERRVTIEVSKEVCLGISKWECQNRGSHHSSLTYCPLSILEVRLAFPVMRVEGSHSENNTLLVAVVRMGLMLALELG